MLLIKTHSTIIPDC